MKTKRCSAEPVARTLGHSAGTTISRPKESPSLQARRKPERGCVLRTSRSTSKHPRASGSSTRSRRIVPALRREFRASLPTALERDTMLMPDVIAEMSEFGEKSLKSAAGWVRVENGRSDRIRTCDFVDPNHAL